MHKVVNSINTASPIRPQPLPPHTLLLADTVSIPFERSTAHCFTPSHSSQRQAVGLRSRQPEAVRGRAASAFACDRLGGEESAERANVRLLPLCDSPDILTRAPRNHAHFAPSPSPLFARPAHRLNRPPPQRRVHVLSDVRARPRAAPCAHQAARGRTKGKRGEARRAGQGWEQGARKRASPAPGLPPLPHVCLLPTSASLAPGLPPPPP